MRRRSWRTQNFSDRRALVGRKGRGSPTLYQNCKPLKHSRRSRPLSLRASAESIRTARSSRSRTGCSGSGSGRGGRAVCAPRSRAPVAAGGRGGVPGRAAAGGRGQWTAVDAERGEGGAGRANAGPFPQHPPGGSRTLGISAWYASQKSPLKPAHHWRKRKMQRGVRSVAERKELRQKLTCIPNSASWWP